MKENRESLEEFKERFVLARSRLLRQEPFLGFLALELPTHFFGEAEEPTFTAATDGCRYFYNYNWCRQLTDAELVFVIAHEVAHVVSLHMLRRGDREHNRWNAACDFAINGLLVASCARGGPLNGVAAMPSITDPRTRRPKPIGLWDERFINWTAECIYDELGSATDLRLNWDQLLEPGVDREKAEAEAHSRAAVAKSLIRAREHRQQHGAGDEPGGWERLAEAGLHPIVMWQDRLRRRALSWGFDSISWDRPNRKYRPHGFYFPRHRGYQLPDLIFAFDTSGSVSDQFLGQMIAELNGLLTLARNSVIRVICCESCRVGFSPPRESCSVFTAH